MNIGVIGTGSIGSTLIRRLTAAGHHVAMANSRGPETLTDLAAETGAMPVAATEVGHEADVVIVAIPSWAITTLPDDVLSELPAGSAVVDTANYVPHLRDGAIAELDEGTVESRWTESHLHRPVVKAFNNIKADHLRMLGKPSGSAGRIALPVSGDDPAAKAVVMRLVDQVGFDSIDAGGLADSWRQQPGTPVYTTDLDAAGVRQALAAASFDQTLAWRARMVPPPA
ncbi:MAG: 8-hydroxy-5-deazaflavin:NADPH oxidoreductase [Frankiales bacterium]|jgi:predicted dinucleotide-binding enzyme|nr:8-hydroxy-5-deazaflavin:NADPH oxidoreductase [Frankiales bacterium]